MAMNDRDLFAQAFQALKGLPAALLEHAKVPFSTAAPPRLPQWRAIDGAHSRAALSPPPVLALPP